MKQTTSTTHINSSRASQPGDYVAENIPLSAETTTISPTISPRDSEKKKAWPSVPVEVDNYFHSEPLETDSNKIKYFEINEFDVAKLAHDLADNISVTSIQSRH